MLELQYDKIGMCTDIIDKTGSPVFLKQEDISSSKDSFLRINGIYTVLIWSMNVFIQKEKGSVWKGDEFYEFEWGTILASFCCKI